MIIKNFRKSKMIEKVSVVKCPSYESDVLNAVNSAIGLAGGLELKKGMKVLIKPNQLSAEKPEKAITTHPVIIDALCRTLKKKDVEIWIGDSSGTGELNSSKLGTDAVFKVSGIKDVAKKYNARLISFESAGSIKVANPKGVVLKEINIAKPVIEADYIINVPKLKTHFLVKYTGAVKNMFGCIPGGGKGKCHFIAPKEDKFCHLLLDIYEVIKPDFVLMDAVVGLEGDGPGTGGKPKNTGLIIASKDAVATDIVASKIIGYNAMDIFTNKFALKRNIFTKKIEVVGEKDINVSYKKPLAKPVGKFGFVGNWISKQAIVRPEVNKENCKKCGICAKVCPVNAIYYNPYPSWNRKKCILCYRCHELCPHNAIMLGRPKLIESITKTYQLVFRKK